MCTPLAQQQPARQGPDRIAGFGSAGSGIGASIGAVDVIA
jgi:hypothetical protein